MPGKVFSVTDFKAGLDVRKTALTAPGGSLRILENAVLNQGGEVEKRLAFVHKTQMPPQYIYLAGRNESLTLLALTPGTRRSRRDRCRSASSRKTWRPRRNRSR